ncbi:MAG: DoxX family membrane protein [Planctomycetota bacterium]
MTNLTRRDWGLFLIRALPAVVLLFHGSQKLFGAFGGPGIQGFATFLEGHDVGYPLLGAWASGLTEFVGGLALLSGIGVRALAIPLVINFAAACGIAHTGFAAGQGGMEYPLTLAFVFAGLGLTGAGEVTIPGLIARSRQVAEVPTTPTKAQREERAREPVGAGKGAAEKIGAGQAGAEKIGAGKGAAEKTGAGQAGAERIGAGKGAAEKVGAGQAGAEKAGAGKGGRA